MTEARLARRSFGALCRPLGRLCTMVRSVPPTEELAMPTGTSRLLPLLLAVSAAACADASFDDSRPYDDDPTVEDEGIAEQTAPLVLRTSEGTGQAVTFSTSLGTI